jgi:hypothetical protein
VFKYLPTPDLIADYTLLGCETFPWGKEGYNCRGGVLSYLCFNFRLDLYIATTCFLKLATWMQLNKFYMDICKSALIPPVGILEISNICRVLSDQVILYLKLNMFLIM